MDEPKSTIAINDQKPKEMIRVSVSEAARLFGVNSQTIRRAITAQEITYVIVAGRYKVNFESLVKWSQHHTTVKNKLANKGIGQFVEKWKIKNPLYSPNPKSLQIRKEDASTDEVTQK
jgi:excisionase family DNA binding protein